MMRFLTRRHKTVGLPPGTLEFVGEKKVDKARITVWDYDMDEDKEVGANTDGQALDLDTGARGVLR